MFTIRNVTIGFAVLVVAFLAFILFKPAEKKVDVTPQKPAATQQVAPAKPAEPAKKDDKKK